MDVFISYSRKDRAQGGSADRDVIGRVQDAFRTAGISYWLDEEGIHSGETFASVISRNIAECSIFLFISSINSNASRWTCGEIATASSYNKRIIPFKIDDAPYDPSVTIYLAALDTIDYKTNPDKALRRLVNSVQNYLEELEAERKRIEEEQRLIEEQKRLAAERERIRIENEKIIARLSIKEAELEEKIGVLDGRIDNLLVDKSKLVDRLNAIKNSSSKVPERSILASSSAAPLKVPYSETESPSVGALRWWIFVAIALLVAVILFLLLRKPSRRSGDYQVSTDIVPSDTLAAEESLSRDTFVVAVPVAATESQVIAAPVNIPVQEKQISSEKEESKTVFLVDGKETGFTISSAELGGERIIRVEGGRYTIEPKRGDWWEVLNETRQGFTLHWEKNNGPARSFELKVKSGKKVIKINLSQSGSSLYADSLKLSEIAAKVVEAQEEKLEEEKREKTSIEDIQEVPRVTIPPIIPFEVNGLRFYMKWVEERVENNRPVGFYISKDVVSEALRKKVMENGKDVRDRDLKTPASTDPEKAQLFLTELNKLTGQKFTIVTIEEVLTAEEKGAISNKAHGFYIVLRPN